MFLVTKQVEFAAAHRLYKEGLSDAVNHELFGACANPYGHGHNYLLEVCVKGIPREDSEMVVHFAKLKLLLHELVVTPLDHRHLNHDVAFLKGILPTSENLVRLLWERVGAAVADEPWKLYRMKLSSSPRSWVEYFGDADGHA